MICGVIYQHPQGNMQNFMDFLNSTIEKIDRENKFCIILGDFILDLLKMDSHPDTGNFLHTLGSFNFQTHILQPTRITDHSQTSIDNIFFNSLEHLTLSGNIIYDLTDHLPNFVIIKKLTSLPNNVKIYKRDYSNFDESTLIQDMRSVDRGGVLHADPDPNVMFDSFYTRISDIIDVHIPLIQLSKGELRMKSKPWITIALRVSIHIRNKLFKKYVSANSVYYHTRIKLYRNKINQLLKVSQSNNYNNYFHVNMSDSKKVWKGIRHLVNLKSKSGSTPTKLLVDDHVEITDPKSMADAFNNFFANTGYNLTKNIPSVNKSPLQYLTAPSQDSFFLFPTTNKLCATGN